jgi:hypothetical protein
MFPATRKGYIAALAAGIGSLAVLGNVAITGSPIPLAFLALAVLVAGLHAPSLNAKLRRLLFLTGIVAAVGSNVLTAARFA